MVYAPAVVKETLHLWPPIATVRRTAPGNGLTAAIRVNDVSKEGNLDGMMLYVVAAHDPA